MDKFSSKLLGSTGYEPNATVSYCVVAEKGGKGVSGQRFQKWVDIGMPCANGIFDLDWFRSNKHLVGFLFLFTILFTRRGEADHRSDQMVAKSLIASRTHNGASQVCLLLSTKNRWHCWRADVQNVHTQQRLNGRLENTEWKDNPDLTKNKTRKKKYHMRIVVLVLFMTPETFFGVLHWSGTDLHRGPIARPRWTSVPLRKDVAGHAQFAFGPGRKNIAKKWTNDNCIGNI